MNNGLLYLCQMNVKNRFKKLIRKPLKLIATIVGVLYFIMIPFFFKSSIDQLNMNNQHSFGLIILLFTIYLSTPGYLSYLKRKGIVFTNADVHFLFSAPVSSKQIIFYGLSKTYYLQVIYEIALIVAALFLFNVSALPLLLYVLSIFIFEIPMSYSLALIMYADEKISLTAKKVIRYTAYAFLLIFTALSAYYIYSNGISVQSVIEVFQLPLILLFPIIGWQACLIQLLFWGPTNVNIVGTVLFFIFGLISIVYAYRMKVNGEYYEEAQDFALDYEKKMAKAKKNAPLSEQMGKRKILKANREITSLKSRAILDKELLENRRTRRTFVKISDLVLAIIGGFVGYFLKDSLAVFGTEEAFIFFGVIVGIIMYINAFFTHSNFWQKEAEHFTFFLIPDTMISKLFFASSLDLLSALTRTFALVLPLMVISRVPLVYGMMGILLALSLLVFEIYLRMGLSEFLTQKVGTIFAQFIYMFLSIILCAVPVGLWGLMTWFTAMPTLVGVLLTVLSYFGLAYFGLWIASKTILHTQLEDN